MKYEQATAVFVILSSEDVIAASFNKTVITEGNYSEDKDVISFEDLIG